MQIAFANHVSCYRIESLKNINFHEKIVDINFSNTATLKTFTQKCSHDIQTIFKKLAWITWKTLSIGKKKICGRNFWELTKIQKSFGTPTLKILICMTCSKLHSSMGDKFTQFIQTSNFILLLTYYTFSFHKIPKLLLTLFFTGG